MDHIIKDLLKLSELESERAIMQMAEIDLAALFDDVLFSYSELIKQKDLKLDYDLDDSLPLIADEKNMEIVIRNVIGNAIVHTNQGARIKISSEITGSQCRLEVFNEAE
ncbi:HAMP domain-containing histidine kinase, partial [Aduncisulcus paluster]